MPATSAGMTISIVARMKRSEIRGKVEAASLNPGLRFAPSGLRLLVLISFPGFRRQSAALPSI
jgi:hypothetical protein